MNAYRRPLCSFLLIALVFELASGQDEAYFLKASKNVPRIGKRSKGMDEPPFEKFFLKASKSVPRIGRRGSPSELVPLQQKDLGMKYPTWSDLAELYEYNPELFSSPQLLAKLGGEYGMVADDPNAYEWDRIQMKRNNNAPSENGELIEYKLQPEVTY